MQTISVDFDSKEIKSDKWLKITNFACSYSGLTGQKSPWQLADLALKVQSLWKNHPEHNLESLSCICGISKQRLELLARTAKFFPSTSRFEALSITHHIEAMRLDPKKARYWLKKALEKKWNGKDIRLAIAGDGDPKKYSWLRSGTFWYFSHCDNRFGITHPGRIPGQISANLIHYFTEPNDLVVDLMAGGGGTLDAAKFLERRCLSYDLAPVRPDIQKNDALIGIPKAAHKAKLIFIDPPYGSIAKGMYKYHHHCLSHMNRHEFFEALEIIGNYCLKALQKDGYLAVLMQNINNWEGHTVIDLVQQFIDNNWKLVRRIQAPISNQQISSSVMKWAKENRQMVNTDRDLLIFQAQ